MHLCHLHNNLSVDGDDFVFFLYWIKSKMYLKIIRKYMCQEIIYSYKCKNCYTENFEVCTDAAGNVDIR